MTTSTMHFGPEWMRAKLPTTVNTRSCASSSPPPPASNGTTNGSTVPPGASSYSSLVTPPPAPAQLKRDIAHPFKYSRDEMLQVWKDGGGSGALPIEVERWEVVKQEAGEPVSLQELSETEKKLYATSLTSETRRRQSTDFANQADRTKPYPLSTGALGNTLRRRRGDSSGTDHPPLTIQRKMSNSTAPSLVSPRTRLGGSGGGFDGVLNGSDNAWTGIKRHVSGGQSSTTRLDETPELTSEPDSKEKEVDTVREEVSQQPLTTTAATDTIPGGTTELSSGLEALSLGNGTEEQGVQLQANQATTINQPDSVPPEQILWSYIDFQGNTQGPFPGEKMQYWHEGGFFTDDLRMKRTHIDTEFMTLADIKRRARGERIFLSVLVDLPLMPPGLGANSLLQRTGVLDSLRQPAPMAYSRHTSLDTSFGMGSMTSSSASPSSSLGGNFGRASISPDLIALGNRGLTHRFNAEMPLNGRLSANSFSSGGSPAIPPAGRYPMNESLHFSDQQVNVGGQPTSPWSATNVNGWNEQLAFHRNNYPLNASNVQHSLNRESAYHPTAWATPSDQANQSNPLNNYYGTPNDINVTNRGFVQQAGEMSMNLGMRQVDDSYGYGLQQSNLPMLSAGFNQNFNQSSSPVVQSPIVSLSQSHLEQQHNQPISSPWPVAPTQEDIQAHSVNVENMATNTFPSTLLSQSSAWNASETNTAATHQEIVVENQVMESGSQPPVGEQSLPSISHDDRSSETTASILTTNEPIIEQKNVKLAPALAISTSTSKTVAHAKQTIPRETDTERKESTAAVNTSQKKSPKSPLDSTTVPTTPQQPPKSAWGSVEESKAKQHHPSLREIQESEKKRQEARKPVELERDRTVRSTAPANEEKTFTTAWGLPSSHATSRPNGVITSKESPASSPAQTTAPAWTTASKPVAKTMKEIQEEEERQKRSLKERETVTTAKRAAATVPAKPLAQTQVGGAWTVVGNSGKPSATPSMASVARPSMASQVSASSTSNTTASRPPASTAQRVASSPQIVKAVNNPPSKNDEGPIPPSLEFMKWMRDSLQRGLNNTVSFEEIAKMLLSFPLDPDPSTIEIIAETVYGASTTLNGRQFATEFIAKRKADVASASKTGPSSASGKAPSLADIVKAPKAAPNNDFGYKVVKKKGKTGR